MTLPTLGLLLHLVGATAPACEPADLACTARESAREARHASDPFDGAVAHVTAARANLGLYRESGDLARLCDARRHLNQVPQAVASELGDLPRETRREVTSELTRLGHTCQARPRRSAAVAPAGPSSEPEPRPTLPPKEAVDLLDIDRSQKVAPGPAAAASTSVGSTPASALPGTSSAPNVQVQGSARAPGHEPASSRRHSGRGLMIAGGVVLASGVFTAGLTAIAAVRRDEALQKHDELASEASGQGYTAPNTDAERRVLEADARRWHNVVIGASIATGVAAATAVALLTTGIVKSRRTPSRLVVSPLLPGLLLTARF